MRLPQAPLTLAPQLGVHPDRKSWHPDGSDRMTCLEWMNVCRVTRAGKRVSNGDRHF
jgi:hypothetical protein